MSKYVFAGLLPSPALNMRGVLPPVSPGNPETDPLPLRAGVLANHSVCAASPRAQREAREAATA